MSKSIMRLSVITCIILIAGLVAFANQYNVSGLSFTGVMIGTGDTDWLDLQGQEGTHPNICLDHGRGVDFDIAVFNNDVQVCSNVTMHRTSCCRGVSAPGHVKVKIWSVRGSGNYKVTIQP